MNAVRDERTCVEDPELKRTDALAYRWSRITYDRPKMHSLEVIRLMKDGAVLGGNLGVMGDDVLAFDQCYAVAPIKYKTFVSVWYKGDGSSLQKAKRLGMSRTSLYLEWKKTLCFFHGALLTRGLDI